MKNHGLFLTFITIAVITIVFESCSKNQNTNTDTGYASHEVYIAGTSLSDTSFAERAAYWKNGVINFVGGINSNAQGIFVDGSDVYVSGNYYGYGSRLSRTYSGFYWKNGTSYTLSTAYPGTTPVVGNGSNNIFVSNGNVYVAGYDNGHATVWKNGVPSTLDTTKSSSTAFSVFVSGSDVYVCGSVFKTTTCCTASIATVWKNGVPLTLGLGESAALCVFVKGSDVYVVGYDDPNPFGTSGHMKAPTYWKNGTAVQLDNINASQVNSIYVDGTDVYALGTTTLWKNGIASNLNQGAGTFCTAVVARNAEVFITGGAPQSLPYNSSYSTVTYWHNSSVFNFPLYGYGNALFVK